MNAITKTDLHQLLQEKFGWADFKSGQRQTIETLLDNQSALAVFPTGGGKSLCYQLPALKFDGLTVVVSPLIALMKDQIDQLQNIGIHAVRLDSSLTPNQYRETMEALRKGQARILYVAPERFFNERFRGFLESVNISMLAIDEAHCISEWGHNFRPDYLKLTRIARQLAVERVLALTATATPTVQNDICDAFAIHPEAVFCTEFFRPNLHIRSQLVHDSERLQVLIGKLKSQKPGATIVYVTLQKTAVEVAAACTRAGLVANAYHAGMKSEQREKIQDWFMSHENAIVVATIAFGMGIDKSDIRYIYHFNPPKSLENYAQEIGRAGRDGQNSLCQLLLVPQDRIVLENFVYGDTPTEAGMTQFMEEIATQPTEFFISQYRLGILCDLKPLIVKTLLTYLELDGYLDSTTSRYESYTLKPAVAFTTIIGQFAGERQRFVKSLLSCCQKKKSWFHIDIDATTRKLDCERSRIVKALDYFSEQGWIKLKTTGSTHGYRKSKPLSAPALLASHYSQLAQRREKSEIQRIDQIFALAQGQTCQAAMLAAHFGQSLAQGCGVCSFCSGNEPLELETSEPAPIAADIIADVKQLITEHPSVLSSSRSVARLLCGLTSPALTRARLSKSPLFGSCSQIPFAEVMRQSGEWIRGLSPTIL